MAALFKRLIFDPIIELLAPQNAQVKAAKKTLKNSKILKNAKYDTLIAGINSGKIQYVAGSFTGDFSAALSRDLRALGAKFNKRTSAFTIVPEALPAEVLQAIKDYASTARKLHEALEDKLRNIEFTLSYEIQQNPIKADRMIEKLDKKFQDQYGDALQISDLSKESKKKLARMYSQSLSPYIKKFSDEQIKDLRAMVKANAETGYRFDTLVQRIENKFNVTQSKAEFLARNETTAYVSKARQIRFQEVGATHYVWRTSNDSNVRKDHAHLKGQTFEYSKPPIVDVATGRRGNPGTDYNCRCIDDVIISNILETA